MNPMQSILSEKKDPIQSRKLVSSDIASRLPPSPGAAVLTRGTFPHSQEDPGASATTISTHMATFDGGPILTHAFFPNLFA